MRAIFHADKNWGIGRGNDLMFRLPLDMKFFRETTSGKVVVMGLNTLRSFPGGKPLKNRTNVVLSPEDVEGDVITVTPPVEEETLSEGDVTVLPAEPCPPPEEPLVAVFLS